MSDDLVDDVAEVAGESVLEAEIWASEWLSVTLVGPRGEPEAAAELCLDVARRAIRRPSPHALAAVSALRRVAPESVLAEVDQAVRKLRASQSAPPWIDAPAPVPVAAWRAVDVWGSDRVLFVEFGEPAPHALRARISTAGGVYVTDLDVLVTSVTKSWARERHRSPMPLTEQPPAEVLAELAEALRSTDMTWPPNADDEYVGMWALAWARCRSVSVPGERPGWEPLPDDERAMLVAEFIASGAPDNDVTSCLAKWFLDYGDGYIDAGHLAWSPDEVELFLLDWLPRKVTLDAGQRAVLPALLKRWIRFALERRGLETQWIEPVVGEVDLHLDDILFDQPN